MALPATGTITLAQIQAEFGGSNPISLNEYYRGGGNVPNATKNNTIPTSGAISLANFRSTGKFASITFDIIGGGGSGGYGREDGSATDRAPSGGTSSITVRTQTGTNIFGQPTFQTDTYASAAGGIGGANGAFVWSTVSPGANSAYGTGGAGGTEGGAGGNATGYGAGGGGGGGDEANNNYGDDGNAGEGGYAGTRSTGSLSFLYGTVLRITVGGAGSGSGGDFPGGSGSQGLVRLNVDGAAIDFVTTQNFTVN